MTRASTAGAIVTDSSRAVNLSLEQAQASFRRHLRATNKAPHTIQTYLDALDHFGRYLSAARLPLDVGLIDPEHVEAWLVKLQDDGRRAASVANRYRSLQQFFRWLADEEEIARSPMARMKPPAVPVQPPPVLGEEQLRRLLKAAFPKVRGGRIGQALAWGPAARPAGSGSVLRCHKRRLFCSPETRERVG